MIQTDIVEMIHVSCEMDSGHVATPRESARSHGWMEGTEGPFADWILPDRVFPPRWIPATAQGMRDGFVPPFLNYGKLWKLRGGRREDRGDAP